MRAEARPTSPTGDERELSLQGLTDAAGVSVRTVRYYIAEGLLPPPVGAGPRSAYTGGHLDRLRLIGRLKDAYLPLKEIRRRVAGLDDAEIRQLLADADVGPATGERVAQDSAAAYLDRVLGPRPVARALSAPAPPLHRLGFGALEARAEVAAADDLRQQMREEPLSLGAVEPIESGGSWRRFALGDDAELLIREEAYERRRDQVEWLVAWARKVFG